MSKMDVHFSSKTDEWPTPADLIAQIKQAYPLELDVCATHENAKAPRYFTKDDDGLAQEWRGVCWMNPPYGRGIGKWVAKAAESADTLGSVVVTLLPARTDTKWWHTYCEPVLRGQKPGEVIFLKGRVKFGDAKTGAPFPSVIVVFGSMPPAGGAA